MRRRGPFRRPFRRAKPFDVPPELRSANELMEAGQYSEAALAFEQIAEQAERRRGPRAPLFHLRAGQAYAKANDTQNAMPHLKKGLGMIAARGDWAPLDDFGQRAVDELKQLGYATEAEELAAYLVTLLPHKTPKRTRAEKAVSLPTHCPGCGAPLRADEVEWMDQETAECIYCGSPVRGED